MENEPLKIKKRGDDGYRFISVRIKEATLTEIDKVAAESNYSRNELINLILEHGIDKIVVHAPRYLDGKRVQLIDIYYNGVGILRELTPEEMEEAFQKHMAERKVKTA